MRAGSGVNRDPARDRAVRDKRQDPHPSSSIFLQSLEYPPGSLPRPSWLSTA
ncbi:hypothetical protein PAXRUDRAFT_805883 [Paxillus rubicundulus Ve08.2h10]|uniref:Uncharacterized protein n=1 Tax=Paxillus rubicundulus Ve08.2h10 TaxID=930991 RepID=A0A0D0DCQ1_9AGAM|nr:hypothetical protein PAXRUDRAFT_805883 [Paxillus rubicundulus Ve08.2h10]